LSLARSVSVAWLTEATRRRQAAAAPADGQTTRRGWGRIAVAAGAITAGFALLVVLLYVTALHASLPDSDGATVVLQGQVMSAGNLTLHGWGLSLDPFWTVDALFYTVIERFTGMQPYLLYLVPAIIAALVIIVGAALARGRRRGLAGVAAAVTVVALLALPSHALGAFFLRGPLHVGTALWCLIAFAGLRSGRFGWGWAIAVVFFAIGTLGDVETVVFGLLPAIAAGLVAMARTRRRRAGLPEVSAAGLAVVGAWLIREAAVFVGTYSIKTGHPRSTLAQMPGNVKYLVPWFANMLGVGNGSGVAWPVQVVHVVGLAVVLAGVAAALVALVRGVVKGTPAEPGGAEPWRLDDLLVLAFFADLVVFIGLTLGNFPDFMRELTVAVIFGAVLAGRWVGRLADAVSSPRLRRGGVIAGLAVIAVFAAGLGLNIAAPRPVRTYDQLARFLAAHHLTQGLGDYWSSSIVTVTTGGTIAVRPVFYKQGLMIRYHRQSSGIWYTGQTFQFLVYNPATPWQGVDAANAATAYGPIAHTYDVGTYRVLVWNQPIRVDKHELVSGTTSPS